MGEIIQEIDENELQQQQEMQHQQQVQLIQEVAESVDIITDTEPQNGAVEQKPSGYSFVRQQPSSIWLREGQEITDEVVGECDYFYKLKSEDGKFWYKCRWQNCHYGNRNENFMVRHVRKHELPYHCPWPGCKAHFAGLNDMAEHHNAIHTGDTPFPCDFPGCDERFADELSLSTHRMRHLPPPPTREKVASARKALPKKEFHCSFGKCGVY